MVAADGEASLGRRQAHSVSRLELAPEAVLQAGVPVIVSGTETAARLDRGPLLTDEAA